MKSFAIAAALLASVAIAQPHGHQHNARRGKQHAHEHDKRELVVEIETEWVTATVIIGDDSTQTIAPTNTGAEFFEPSSTAVPVVAPQPTTLIPQVAPAPSPSTSSPPASPTPEPTPEPAPEPTTAAVVQEITTAAAVVVPPVLPSVVETPVVASTTTPAAPEQPAPSSGGGSSSGGSSGDHATRTGDITYYDIGQGACGYDDSAVNDTGFVAALSADFWNSVSTLTNSGVNQPSNPLCDKKVTLTANGKSVEVTARDKCPGCNANAIDVSKAAFIALFGDLGVGRGTVTWSISY